MSWNEERSRDRIRDLLGTVPAATISVERFETQYLPRRSTFLAESRNAGVYEPTIGNLSNREAVLTNGAHVYANLVDFNPVLTEQDRETEASHNRALQFLHIHYSACDRLVEAFEIERVDYHGSRLHAVVLTPTGEANEADRIRKALDFAAAFRRMVAESARVYGGRFDTRVKIGIDSGWAVAINSGKRGEPEPLFLGDPANVAAKLADGDGDGVYLSQRAQELVLGVHQNPWTQSRVLAEAEEENYFRRSIDPSVWGERTATRVEEAFGVQARDQVLINEVASDASFAFHRHQPPLRTIDFARLMPSNTIRMEMAALFADIDEFTPYVREAIATGRVAELVSNLHVLRGELAAVLRDFGGRKIRFVGDCVQGVLAEGDHASTNERETADKSVFCASGMRSSFQLAKGILPNITKLGLAIGVEVGTTPITRLGLRGDRSVRCSASKAVCVSEEIQRNCQGDQTAVGERAINAMSPRLAAAFDEGVAIGLTYDNATLFASGVTMSNSTEPVEAHSATDG